MPTTGLAIRGGKLLREGGKLNIADKATGCAACCDTGVCVECGYCSGCAEEDKPDCPTAACCTPHRISAVITGVETFFDQCHPDFATSRKMTGTTPINRTVILQQDPNDPCRWFKALANDFRATIFNTTTCNGVIFTNVFTEPLVYELRRISATKWSWRVYCFDQMIVSFVGPADDCGDDLTTAIEFDADPNDCKNIGVCTHLVRASCFVGFTPGQVILGSGGQTTFEVCP